MTAKKQKWGDKSERERAQEGQKGKQDKKQPIREFRENWGTMQCRVTYEGTTGVISTREILDRIVYINLTILGDFVILVCPIRSYARVIVYYFSILDFHTGHFLEMWYMDIDMHRMRQPTLATLPTEINIWRFWKFWKFWKLHWIRELSFSWPSRTWLFCFPIRTHERNHKHILIHQAAATILGQKWYRQIKAKCSRSETICLYGPGFLSSQRHTECKEYRFFLLGVEADQHATTCNHRRAQRKKAHLSKIAERRGKKSARRYRRCKKSCAAR